MYPRRYHNRSIRLLVEGLGVGGGGRNVGVTGSLVRASGELELVGGLEVGIAGGAVGGGVILEIEKESEHFCTNSNLDPSIHFNNSTTHETRKSSAKALSPVGWIRAV